MSNYLAIATVTEALRQMLESALRRDFTESLNEPAATAVRPNAGAAGLPKLGVNLCLYQVSSNGACCNADLPTRRADGSPAQTPRAALDLHYLLSFYGEESRLEPQQAMGSVIRALHASPALLREQIARLIAASDPLKNSDLDRAVERIRLTPLPLTLEELSKIWSVFFQNSYTLSIAYTASVLFIDGYEKPAAPLPVGARQVYTLPFSSPLIEQVLGQPDADALPRPSQRFAAGSRLVLAGRRLKGGKTSVRIDGADIGVAQILDIRNDSVTLLLPEALRPGVHSICVAHRLMIGDPPAEHAASESNSAAFLLCPVLTVPADPLMPALVPASGHCVYQTPIPIGMMPSCGRRQRVYLLLNEYDPAPAGAGAAYRVEAPDDNGITDPTVQETNLLSFVLTTSVKPKAGKYICRVVVDGAQSFVTFDPAGPLVEIADAP